MKRNRGYPGQQGRLRHWAGIGALVVGGLALLVALRQEDQLPQPLSDWLAKAPELKEQARDLTARARARLEALSGEPAQSDPPLDSDATVDFQTHRIDPRQLMHLYDPEGPLVVEEVPSLPALDDSDALVRRGIESLGEDDLLGGWLIDQELVRRFVVMVDNIAEGRLPRKHSLLAPPKGAFLVTGEADTYWLDPTSYRRYDPYTRVLLAIDPERALQVYRQYYPLMQQAYAELGYPRRSFHARFLQALDHLLEGPVVEGPIALVRPSVFYKYADPALEALPGAQKQLLRMGPENTRRIQQRLQDYRTALARFTHQPG